MWAKEGMDELEIVELLEKAGEYRKERLVMHWKRV